MKLWRDLAELKKEIAEMYKSGMTIGQIARAKGIGYTTALRLLHEAGVEVRRGAKRRLPAATCPKCGQEGSFVIATNSKTLRKVVLIRHKDRLCYISTLSNLPHKYPQLIKELHQRGMPPEEIAKRLDMAEAEVRRLLEG
ncbi:MAG: helix-turn-helix domain-containing protein [Pyrobaculum sp.]